MHTTAAGIRRLRTHRRRTEIITAASRLIQRRGYANVSMKDIAEAVGVSAPALYKHFAGKRELLAVAISQGLSVAEAAAAGVAEDGLEETIRALAAAAVDERSLWVLLSRESRHLDPADLDDLSCRFSALVDVIARQINAIRNDLDDQRAKLAAQAVLAALSAPSQYEQTASRRVVVDTLANGARRAIDAGGGGSGSLRVPLPGRPFNPAIHRREGIMQEATALFAEHGYDAVTLDDIGKAVFIAGPSVYNHFDGKSDILAGILWRSVDWIESDMSRAIAVHDEASDALRQIYEDYTAIAITNRDLFRVFTVEGRHLSRTERDRIGRAHTHFLDRWISLLLASASPPPDPPAARVLVTASLSVINDLADRAPFRGEPARSRFLAAIAMAVAGVDVGSHLR